MFCLLEVSESIGNAAQKRKESAVDEVANLIERSRLEVKQSLERSIPKYFEVLKVLQQGAQLCEKRQWLTFLQQFQESLAKRVEFVEFAEGGECLAVSP